MLMIATDEAGYGPKLGPLVVAATVWRIPALGLQQAELETAFAPLQQAATIQGQKIVIDDSKAVYKPSGGLAALHATVSASLRWCGWAEPTLSQLLPRLCRQDYQTIQKTPWLQNISDDPLLTTEVTKELVDHWRSGGMELLDVAIRVIPANEFNLACRADCNKSDLLSESTLGLVAPLVERYGGGETEIQVRCDRHGGRRYYGGILQHHFPDSLLRIVSESSQESRYRLSNESSEIDVRFTVKGDSFPPVALASLHAKYLRERCMESFNRFFEQRHQDPAPFRPTAGYPVDADRFLKQIQATIEREAIPIDQLVRTR